MIVDYPTIWALIMLVGLTVYAALDGFDLGVGILHFTTKNPKEHDLMMSSIAPFWDGNETWLVLIGGGMYSVFPFVYNHVFPLLYMPIMLMLFSLIFRGICFEFRFKTQEHYRWVWRWLFALSSFSAAFLQGVIIGCFMEGLPLNAAGELLVDHYSWLTSFTALSGFSTALIYALMGSTWLWMKLPQPYDSKYRLKAIVVLMLLLLVWDVYYFMFVPNVFSLNTVPYMPNLLYKLEVIVVFCTVFYSLYRKYVHLPFLLSLFLVASMVAHAAKMYWPYIAPFNVDIWKASSIPQTQALVLVGALIFIPLILVYSIYVYYVFHGKTSIADIHKY